MSFHGVHLGRLPTRAEREEEQRRAHAGAAPPPFHPSGLVVVRTVPEWDVQRRPQLFRPAPVPAPQRPQPEPAAVTLPVKSQQLPKKRGRMVIGSPEHRRAVGEKARERWASMTPEERAEIGRRAAATRLARQSKEVRSAAMKARRARESPERRREIAAKGAAGLAARPFEVRSARAKKAAQTAKTTAKGRKALEENGKRIGEHWKTKTREERCAQSRRSAATRWGVMVRDDRPACPTEGCAGHVRRAGTKGGKQR